MIDGMRIGHYVHPYAARMIARPIRGNENPQRQAVAGGWDLIHPEYTNFRVYMYHGASLDQYRSFPGGSVCRSPRRWNRQPPSSAGFSNIPLDFWENHDGHSILGRFHTGWVGAFHRQNTYWLIAPGPDGPVGTARYEMLREGLQETEARIALERALTADTLDEDLESPVRTLLAERVRTLWLDSRFAESNTQWQKGGMHDYGVADQWQASTATLFDLAGRAAAD